MALAVRSDHEMTRKEIKMKKTVAAILLLCLTVALFACSENEKAVVEKTVVEGDYHAEPDFLSSSSETIGAPFTGVTPDRARIEEAARRQFNADVGIHYLSSRVDEIKYAQKDGVLWAVVFISYVTGYDHNDCPVMGGLSYAVEIARIGQ